MALPPLDERARERAAEQDWDLTLLDPQDPDERSVLIRLAHPDLDHGIDSATPLRPWAARPSARRIARILGRRVRPGPHEARATTPIPSPLTAGHASLGAPHTWTQRPGALPLDPPNRSPAEVSCWPHSSADRADNPRSREPMAIGAKTRDSGSFKARATPVAPSQIEAPDPGVVCATATVRRGTLRWVQKLRHRTFPSGTAMRTRPWRVRGRNAWRRHASGSAGRRRIALPAAGDSR